MGLQDGGNTTNPKLALRGRRCAFQLKCGQITKKATGYLMAMGAPRICPTRPHRTAISSAVIREVRWPRNPGAFPCTRLRPSPRVFAHVVPASAFDLRVFGLAAKRAMGHACVPLHVLDIDRELPLHVLSCMHVPSCMLLPCASPACSPET